MHSGPEEGLVGVDVPDARDAPLVEQERLDRSAAAAGEPFEPLGGETLVERLDPEALDEERIEGLGAEQQLSRAEAARGGDREPQDRAPPAKRRCIPRVRVRPGPSPASRAAGELRTELEPHARV